MRFFMWVNLLLLATAQAQSVITECESYNYTATSTFTEYETFYISVDGRGAIRTITPSALITRSSTLPTTSRTMSVSDAFSEGGINGNRTTTPLTTSTASISDNVPGNGTEVVIPDNTVAPTTSISMSLTTTTPEIPPPTTPVSSATTETTKTTKPTNVTTSSTSESPSTTTTSSSTATPATSSSSTTSATATSATSKTTASTSTSTTPVTTSRSSGTTSQTTSTTTTIATTTSTASTTTSSTTTTAKTNGSSSGSSSTTTTTTLTTKSTTARTSVTTSASTTTSTSTSAAAIVTNKAYIDTVLRHHNQHRLNHTSPAISWNSTLAETARKIANSCVYAHDTATDCSSSSTSCYGQNIGAGYLPTQMSFLISDGFYNSEVNSYTYYGGEPDLDTLHSWGHFSQIVWKIDTKSVGCYTMDCSGRQGGLTFPNGGGQGIRPFFTVCNYGGPGNWVAEFAENVLEPIGLPTIKAGYLCPTLENCEDGAI